MLKNGLALTESTTNLLTSNFNSKEQINHDKEKFINKNKSFKGILIALLAAFFFSLFGILNKKASFVTGSEQSAIRYLMQIILMIIIAKCNKENIFGPKEQRKLLLIRGIFGAISFISFGFSLKYIDESSSQALYNSRLVIIPILAWIFLNEKIKIINVICFFVTIIGVVLICQPFKAAFKTVSSDSTNVTKIIYLKKSFTSNLPTYIDYIGIGLGLISALAASCVAILLKKLTTLKVHYSVNVIFSSYIGFPTAIFISFIMFLTETRNVDPNDYDTWKKLSWQVLFSFTSAVCGCLNQLLVAIANKYTSANKLAIASTSNLLWSYFLEYLIHLIDQSFSFDMDIYKTCGALLILIAAISNTSIS
jgi:drug/metabolite transporter (DMT)-like permease